jgi:hypothetical protein
LVGPVSTSALNDEDRITLAIQAGAAYVILPTEDGALMVKTQSMVDFDDAPDGRARATILMP